MSSDYEGRSVVVPLSYCLFSNPHRDVILVSTHILHDIMSERQLIRAEEAGVVDLRRLCVKWKEKQRCRERGEHTASSELWGNET